MKTIDKMSPYAAYKDGFKMGKQMAYRDALYKLLQRLSIVFNPMFWSYRGLNHAHWRLWRRSLRNISCLRIKLVELRDVMKDGGEEGKRLAHDLTNILNSKY